MHGSHDATSGENLGQVAGEAHSFDLGEVGRVLNHASTDDAGNGDPDGVHRDGLAGGQGGNLRGEQFDQLAAGDGQERIQLVCIFGMAEDLTGEALVLEPSGYDMFGHYDADGGGHCALHSECSRILRNPLISAKSSAVAMP